MMKDKNKIASNGRVPVAVSVVPAVEVPVEVEDAVPVRQARRGAVGSTPGRRMSATECARQAGISRQRVQVLLKQGRSPLEIIDSVRQRRESEQTAAREQKAYRSRQGDGDGGELEPLASSQRRKESALADTRELELAAKRGELVSFSAVQNWLCSCIIAAREIWMGLADLAAHIRQSDSDVEARAIIDAEVRRGLAELEKFANLSKQRIVGGQRDDES